MSRPPKKVFELYPDYQKLLICSPPPKKNRTTSELGQKQKFKLNEAKKIKTKLNVRTEGNIKSCCTI